MLHNIRYYGRGGPLHAAAGFGKLDIMKFLLAEGFNINAYLERNKDNGVTCLMWAVMHQRVHAVQLLISRWAHTQSTPKTCCTPSIFFLRGADIHLQGFWHKTGGTALDFAKCSTKSESQTLINMLTEAKKRNDDHERVDNLINYTSNQL